MRWNEIGLNTDPFPTKSGHEVIFIDYLERYGYSGDYSFVGLLKPSFELVKYTKNGKAENPEHDIVFTEPSDEEHMLGYKKGDRVILGSDCECGKPNCENTFHKEGQFLEQRGDLFVFISQGQWSEEEWIFDIKGTSIKLPKFLPSNSYTWGKFYVKPRN